jgi:hypothetical protein
MLTALSIGRGGLGRFGNTAFTIAGCIGIAVKSGQPYGFPRWQTHDNAIFGDQVDDIESYLCRELPRIPTGMNFQDYGYFFGYRDINLPTGNWSIDAHLQSDKYFNHCLPLIKDTFRFKDEPEQNDYVAIHYRAGDYIDDPNAHHPRCSKEYYEKAVGQFPPDTIFLAFSDNEAEAMKVFTFQATPTIHFKSHKTDYISDFKLMKRCKSFICANSSFSLMAAILGDHPGKKIICPSRWFGTGMPREFDAKDVYPENCIII